MPKAERVLVLDAMGVIYDVGDDVGELLVPFVKEKKGTGDVAAIERLYDEAILGRMSAEEFWTQLGLDPQLEDEYIQTYRLSSGVNEFLNKARERFCSIWCLSNDLSQWSRKLRRRFGLQGWMSGFIVSGDVGCRKPDPRIFHILLERLRAEPAKVIFVDDKTINLDAAAALGYQTVLFSKTASDSSPSRMSVKNFSELAGLIL